MNVYAVKISDISEEKIDKVCILIDPKKRYKIEKLINKKDKIRTLIGEILIRTLIIKELGITNRNITFEKTEFGKPYLKTHCKFQFNISHSGDFVVCVIDDNPIGIDIEEIKEIEYKEISKNLFTLSEFEYIVKNNSKTSLSKFYDIWTLKESYIKCLGEGLVKLLKSFCINLDNDGDIKIGTQNEGKDYMFNRVDIDINYKCAIYSLNKEISNSVTMINQNSLISEYLKISIE
ncbi:4'-phosphopantetheinyl transferase family protein [Clostridium gasigenes]|uniref:4'-phosphopantetheinyl transferase family protein n=1 Tax=Clostridium gasigenes TaxID=94869 RepID=UPI001C0CCB8D|nr:4'-phosphopantetheinyl transferase superfamily protein [Clostridium gasigenes]MBU3102831.1 4'-phosphopantetheinyl transferase superfamily protein [Clostridium gasigenes]